MNNRDRIFFRHNGSMTKASAIFKDDDVAQPRRRYLFARLHYEPKIALSAPMQMPIFRIGPRIEGRHEPKINIHPDEQHTAVNAGSQNVRT
ncbi:hypothetical protein [Methylocella tundrae]|uniref:hypothetical protein n=1 Tax=Methylocella tundrae TaxID=227605 RepID=UPI00141BE61B|nr:hypothetical protein [Methylocella tundrae]WPP04032.1 hypothetical protein SIN04_16465 [Methylocella tundrae]